MTTQMSLPLDRAQEELHLRLKRCAWLQHLLATYATDEGVDPHVAPLWEAWLARSGELPPDFDALPACAGLPPLLTRGDGREITSADEWPARRREILQVLDYWQLGAEPPAPGAMLAENVDAVGSEPGAVVRRLVLVYGPDAKAVAADAALANKDPSMYRTVRLRVEITVPGGIGSFPALVTLGRRQGDRLHGWLGQEASARGYVVCTFDREDAFGARDVFAGQECTELGWWAYAASRCVDYLMGMEKVDGQHIAVGGHSRGAKMALIAAARDKRFAAAVISHPGSGAGMTEPWRYIGEKFGGETLEYSTRVFPYWNHPRLRFFAGRENRLPFDAHFMVALAAPRALLMTEGDADDVGEPWGAQQSYLAARHVWALFGQAERLCIDFHRGGHHLAGPVLESYVDWLDMQFGRRPLQWPNTLMYAYTFDAWRAATGEHIDPAAYPVRLGRSPLQNDNGLRVTTPHDWPAQRETLRERALSVIGALPAARPKGALLGPATQRDGLRTCEITLPGDLPIRLTYPAELCGRAPAVIYLHGYLDACGGAWSAEYGWTPSVGERLARRGFVVAEYDQYGYGRRNREDVMAMYRTTPRRSALGIMVQDACDVREALSALPMVDAARVAAIGYSLGGLVATFAAALDDRFAAGASACGLGSLRRDAHGPATEGLARYAHLRPLLPRLGFFVGYEERVPTDFDELLALVAPRPFLVLAPTLDQDWVHEDVRTCWEAAEPVYALLGAPAALQFVAPEDFNRYPPAYQDIVGQWLAGVLGAVSPSDGPA